GCALKQKDSDSTAAQAMGASPSEDVGEGKEVGNYRVNETSPENANSQDPELETSKIPVEVNSQVEKWIAYFQGRGRPHMERYLARSNRYADLMKKILRQNGLPDDLFYIAMIESGFSARATSHAAAVGYWQFIRGTGKRYGLAINSLVDERRDPILSTQAAADYFKGLYNIFGSWYLAMASYNVGENRVQREIVKNKTRDFWELAKKRRLPRETMNYVPKYLAAKLIAKSPEEYGFTDIEYDEPIEFDHITVEHPVNLKTLAGKMNMDYEVMKALNPKFRGEIAPLKGANLVIRIPVGTQEAATVAALESKVEKVVYIADVGETTSYRVRSGDNLYTIARRFGTSVAKLRDANNLNRRSLLRIGRRLQVPDSGTRRTVVAKSNDVVVAGYYLVRPGDTLSSIADRHDTTVAELRRVNNLSRKSVIRSGKKLKLPNGSSEGGGEDDTKTAESSKSEITIPSAKSLASASEPIPDTHLVKPGDNLYTLARKYGTTVEELGKANNLRRGQVLRSGLKIKIPRAESAQSSQQTGARKPASAKKKVHLVKRGETLTAIAEKYKVSLSILKGANKLRSGSRLLAGSKIVIPSRKID
ncbi:MAG: LysM peptidoglycan-binding domain-containing protein, partial [Pseudobdellovibrionaceae bacterium]